MTDEPMTGAPMEEVIYFLESITNIFPGFMINLDELLINEKEMHVLGKHQDNPVEICVNFNERSWTAFSKGEVIKEWSQNND